MITISSKPTDYMMVKARVHVDVYDSVDFAVLHLSRPFLKELFEVNRIFGGIGQPNLYRLSLWCMQAEFYRWLHVDGSEVVPEEDEDPIGDWLADSEATDFIFVDVEPEFWDTLAKPDEPLRGNLRNHKAEGVSFSAEGKYSGYPFWTETVDILGVIGASGQ